MFRSSLRTRHPGLRPAALAVLVLLLAAVAPPLSAQVAGGQIEVLVRSDNGDPLPGVSVRAVRPDTGFERLAVTGTAGGAVLAALPPATYTVHLELEGFAPVERQGIALRVGQTARVEATMSLATAEEISVTGAAPLVDVLKLDSSTNIVPEQIQSLPVENRDFERLAFIAPGVERERGGFRFIKGGPVIGAGGNASQSTIFVDGVDFTDPALGLSRARFSQDAIQEFRVIANRFDSEIGGSAGGALSIITRSGTNQLHGSGFAFYRDDSLRAEPALAEKKVPFSRGQYGATLGGPIRRDRTHYFLSAEYIDEQNVTLFRPGGAFASLADDVDHPFRQSLGFGSLNHKVSDSQQLSANLVYERYREENFRVGGVNDVSSGQQLNRDNWNLTLSHTWVTGPSGLNELHLQTGRRKYDEPTNSQAPAEWFSSGTTLETGSNILGDLLGDGRTWEARDTYHLYRGDHDLKVGGSVQYVQERSRIDVFQEGLFIYLTDDRSLPLAYSFGEGSSDVTTYTTRIGAFVQDDWHLRPDLTVSLGLRYDVDTRGNNPDFKHPLLSGERKVDRDNFQPRFGFSWDVGGHGRNVFRGGVGRFTGRYLLIPALTELQQNGITGRLVQTRLNGALLGLPFLALDPANPTTTGIPLPPDITLLDQQLDAPQSTQASLGWTHELWESGVFFDAEAIYVDGRDEIVVRDTNFAGNAAVAAGQAARLDPSYNQINTYTNQGRSRYEALVLSLNGTLPGGHLLTTSLTLADKKNISDDFSPEFPFGYPNDPSNIDAEYGRSRADERWRFVASGVFHLPWELTLAPIYEYGSGQPWNRRLGYDANGDGKNSDRLPGVERNSEDGPRFSQLSLRLSRAFALPTGRLEAIAEVFNLFDTTNFDVSSVDGAEFLQGPTLANPSAPFVPNPDFGRFRSTLSPREVQLGLRWVF